VALQRSRQRELAVQTRLTAALERALAVRAQRLLTTHYRRAAAGFRRGGKRGVDAALRTAEADVRKLLTPHYASTGRVFGDRVLDRFGAKALVPVAVKVVSPAATLFEVALEEWILSEGVKQAKRIANVTKVGARALIAAGEAEGLGVAAIASNLVTASGAISRARAIVISRTETHNAATFASQEAARSLEQDLIKVWLAHSGPRTRDTHAAAHEQQRPLDEPYDVGDSQLMRPGDDSLGAPAEEIIQCRCGEDYEPIRGG
jgi:hypothetical protein